MGRSPTMSLVSTGLLPGLEGALPCVILAHRLPPPTGTLKGTRRSATELQLPPQAAERMLDQYAPALTRRARHRAVMLTGGRAAVLAGLRSVCTATGGSLEPVLAGAASCRNCSRGWRKPAGRCRHRGTQRAGAGGPAGLCEPGRIGLSLGHRAISRPGHGFSSWRTAGCASVPAGRSHCGRRSAAAPSRAATHSTRRPAGCFRRAPTTRRSPSTSRSAIPAVPHKPWPAARPR